VSGDAVVPGGTARIAVVDGTGLRSADWRVWTSKNSDDVYLAARLAAGEIKVSLHQSGSWQHGFTSDQAAQGHLSPGSSRHFAIWKRPAEAVSGWTLAVRILVPVSELQARSASRTASRPVLEAQVSPDHDAVVVEVWLESHRSSGLQLDESRMLAQLRQSGGGNVWVISRPTTLPWNPRQRFAGMIADAAAAAEVERHLARKRGQARDEALSICVHDPGVPESELVLCEIAVPPMSPPGG
jgi:hypothetical protein